MGLSGEILSSNPNDVKSKKAKITSDLRVGGTVYFLSLSPIYHSDPKPIVSVCELVHAEGVWNQKTQVCKSKTVLTSRFDSKIYTDVRYNISVLFIESTTGLVSVPDLKLYHSSSCVRVRLKIGDNRPSELFEVMFGWLHVFQRKCIIAFTILVNGMEDENQMETWRSQPELGVSRC